MLIKLKTLHGYTLESLDGNIGKVKDFYFDDKYWTIRYLVADTGNWLTDRQVLISPYALVAAIREEHGIAVALTKKQIENSPALDSDRPVSRQFEEVYYGYYGWPMYFGGPCMWGPVPYIVHDPEEWKKPGHPQKHWDPHLRSSNEVRGYHIHAEDGDIGHVADFVIDDETWTIRYLIVDTRNWRPGNKVLISPNWIDRVSWDEMKVFIHLSREAIRHSPDYAEDALLTRDYESALHRHYDRPGYWINNRHTFQPGEPGHH